MTTSADPQRSGFFRRLAQPEPDAGLPGRRIGRWVRRRFAVGFLVVFPMVVTLFFARFMFGLLDRWFRPISERLFGMEIPGLGFALFIIGLFILGILATNIFGGRLLAAFERRIDGIPLLSPVYQGARQITEAIQIRGSTEFRKVVLLDFPRDGLKSVGFVTREFAHPTVFADEPSALVFVPTTPNPTTGFLVALPQRELEVLEITVEEGVQLLISGGRAADPLPAARRPGRRVAVERCRRGGDPRRLTALAKAPSLKLRPGFRATVRSGRGESPRW